MFGLLSLGPVCTAFSRWCHLFPKLCDFGLEIWRKHGGVIYDSSKVSGVTESRAKVDED